jgi:hypothetical protein
MTSEAKLPMTLLYHVTIYADPQHEEKYSSDLLNTFLYASKYKENLFDQEIVPSYKFMI